MSTSLTGVLRAFCGIGHVECIDQNATALASLFSNIVKNCLNVDIECFDKYGSLGALFDCVVQHETPSLGDRPVRGKATECTAQSIANERSAVTRMVSEFQALTPSFHTGKESRILSKGDLIAGCYMVESEIGRGGQGVVYSAVDISRDDFVAIKIPRAQLSEEEREVFILNACVARDLDHRGVCRVLEVGDDGGDPFIVMEMIDGVTPGDFLRQFGSNRAINVCKLVAAIAEVIRFAHSRGVLHCDLKPSNILVTADGFPVVLDFAPTSQRVKSPSPRGVRKIQYYTPLYAAPELFCGTEATAGADVFSLGVMMFEWLGAKPPFTTESFDLFQFDGVIPPLSGSGVTRSMELICRDMLCLDPGRRVSLDEAVARLGRIISVEFRRLCGDPLLEIRSKVLQGCGALPPIQHQIALHSKCLRADQSERDSRRVCLESIPLETFSIKVFLEPVRRELIHYESVRPRYTSEECRSRWLYPSPQAAHWEGIIHRDLKPANVLMDTIGCVRLADFGLARRQSVLREWLIHSNDAQPMLTFADASIEQMVSEPLDVRMGLASRVAMLYRLTVCQPVRERDLDLFEIAEEVHAGLRGWLTEVGELLVATLCVDLDQLNGWRNRGVAAATTRQVAVLPVARGTASSVAIGEPSGEDHASLMEILLGWVTRKDSQTRGCARGRYAESVAALEEVLKTQGRLLRVVLYQECVGWRQRLRGLYQEIKATVLGVKFDGVLEKLMVLQELQPCGTDPERLVRTVRGKLVVTTWALRPPQIYARAVRPANLPLAKFLGRPQEWNNSVGMKFRLIPAGTFEMGSPDGQGSDDAHPRHPLTITKAWWLSVHPVTQGQWHQVMGTTPWNAQQYPIEGSDVGAPNVSWDDAVEFCRKLSQKEGKHYRLPTEAEWECACGGGTKTAFSFGDDEEQLRQYAWFYGNACDIGERYPRQVAQRRANAFGLYDMHGNVWEWCSDWYGDYPSTPLTDPRGPNSGPSLVLRGGSWSNEPYFVRCAIRDGSTPGYRSNGRGFRVVLE